MKTLSLLLLVIVSFVSCKKTDTAADCTLAPSAIVASSAETTYIENYLFTRGISNATKTYSGAYYVIDAQGTGKSPNMCSLMSLRYEAYLFTGERFDGTSGGTVSFQLSQLIAGWHSTMTLLKAGGTITLYIPPSLGYGSEVKYNADGSVAIPANSYLKFVVELVAVR